MSCELDGWDRTFLNLSSKMAEPFCAVWNLLCFRMVAPLDPEKFENCSTRIQEIATRALIGLGAVSSCLLLYCVPVPVVGGMVALGAGHKILRFIAFALQKEGYTHIRGTAPEKALDPKNPEAKVMSWNICGVGGGMSLDHGGVVNWQSRVDQIVKKIKEEDPDVLVLQEVYDTALAEAIIERLQSDYAHFFAHLGPNVMGSVGGLLVLSKCAVHQFSNTSFTNNHWTLNRGFASLELKATPESATPCARVIGTHLIHGDRPEGRLEQVAQIVSTVAKRTIPTLLVGDLNIERDSQESATLAPHLRHGYQGREPTCTNRLVAQWDEKAKSIPDETIDYISLFNGSLGRNVTLEDVHLVRAFDETYNTKIALSDHHGLAATLKGLS